MGTLAGNLSIKHQHPEFPSDIYLVFEALGVDVVIQKSAKEECTLSLPEYLRTPMAKKIIKSLILKPHSTQDYIFESYKVRSVVCNLLCFINILPLSIKDNAKSSKCSCLCKCCYAGSAPKAWLYC